MNNEKYKIKYEILSILYNILENTPIDAWNEFTETETIYKRQGILKCIEKVKKYNIE